MALFLLGFIITISEPDLQVLAQQVPAVPNLTLILAVACGVGDFLWWRFFVCCSASRPPLSCLFLCGDFLFSRFCSQRIFERSVRFRQCDHGTDDGAVYYAALGVGISATRSDRHAADDSFGLVALCSIGPILAVMMLGLIYNPDSAAYTPPVSRKSQIQSSCGTCLR